MLRNKFIIICVFFSFCVSSTLYTETQINENINNDKTKILNKNFVRSFFVSKNPEQYIKKFIYNSASSQESLVLEHQLYNLLNEVSYQPQQPFLQDFIEDMKQYKVKSFKMHEEGGMPIPVYNIQIRAEGIENIWLAAKSLTYYSNLFNKEPVQTISRLKNNIASLKAPQWLGLKNSIKKISIQSHIKLADYFMKDIESISGLDKFISHYALFTANKDLITVSLKNLDKSNSEYILRNLSNYFDTDFVVEQLIATVINNKNQAFAISMMKPYIDEKNNIKEFLFEYLLDDEFSSNAAFALSATQDAKTINRLEELYITSRRAKQKQQIIFALKMNKSNTANAALKRISKAKVSKNWLKSFEGELR